MDLCDEVLTSLRRIVRAIDLQSRELERRHGLTGPQMILLRELFRLGETSVSKLAQQVNLSQATVTDILNRLEKRDLIRRCKSDTDKRYVKVSLTETALQQLDASIPLLQERFIRKFNSIDEWEQLQLLSSLHRIADMMQAEKLDQLPVMPAGKQDFPPPGNEPRIRGDYTDNLTGKEYI